MWASSFSLLFLVLLRCLTKSTCFSCLYARDERTLPRSLQRHMTAAWGEWGWGMTRSLSSLYAYCLFHLPLTLACDSPLCILCPADEPIVNSKISVHSKNDCKEILNFYQQVSKIFWTSNGLPIYQSNLEFCMQSTRAKTAKRNWGNDVGWKATSR